MVAGVTEAPDPQQKPTSGIYGPDGKPILDPRPVGLRCDLCGRRPQLPEGYNPRSIREIAGPVANDMVGGKFHLLATCDECFTSTIAVLRAAIGILRAENDLVSFAAIIPATEDGTERGN